MNDLLERYLELEKEAKLPRKRTGNAFFAGQDDPRKTLIQKKKIEDECLESIRGVCSLNLYSSVEHRAYIVARQHFRGLTDEAWEYLCFWVEIITEGLDEKYEYWMREWYGNSCMEDV